MQSEHASTQSRPRPDLLAGIATILFGVVLIVAIPQLRHCVSLVIGGHFTEFRDYVRSLGADGIALLLGLMVLHAIVWYPSEIVTTTLGFVYGFAPGLAFGVSGWLLAALLSYALGRSVGRPLLRRLFGRRFDALTTAIHGGGVRLLISGRLIPVMPFALVGYAAGAAHISVWRFSWTSVVGYLPITVAVTYLGSRAQSLSTGDPLLLAVAVVAVLLLMAPLLGRLGRRRRVDPQPVSPE